MLSVTPTLRPAGGLSRLAWGVSGVFAPGLVSADYGLPFPKPVTPVAERILELHNLVLLGCLAAFALVFGFMLYAIVMHRKGRGFKPARFRGHAALEALWPAIPFLALAGAAVPATKVLLEAQDAGKPHMTVAITGYQWRWKYDYPVQDLSFFSSLATPREQIEGGAPKDERYLLEADNPLVLPVGMKVRFVITAHDVIHAWSVPQLGVKQDAVPGFLGEFWASIDEPGTYRGQCAELCGVGHGYMPIVVRAVSQEEFDLWVSGQKSNATVAARKVSGTNAAGAPRL